MGNYGSTRWGNYTPKYTISDCVTLDLAKFKSVGILHQNPLKRGVISQGSMSWHNTRTTGEIASIMLYIDTTGEVDDPHVRLVYQDVARGQQVDDRIRIQYQEMHLGGERPWLTCHCGKRVRSLHKPPNSIYFRCRDCHNLTYVSSQESHRFGTMGELITILDHIKQVHIQLQHSRTGSKRTQRLMKRLERYEGQIYPLEQQHKQELTELF